MFKKLPIKLIRLPGHFFTLLAVRSLRSPKIHLIMIPAYLRVLSIELARGCHYFLSVSGSNDSVAVMQQHFFSKAERFPFGGIAVAKSTMKRTTHHSTA